MLLFWFVSELAWLAVLLNIVDYDRRIKTHRWLELSTFQYDKIKQYYCIYYI